MNLKEREEFINKYRKRNTGCFGCALLCFAHIDVPEAGQSAAHCISYFYHPQATKYYGPSPERDQAVADGHVLANRYDLDTFEFWQMVNFLNDLHEAGVINESDLPLEKIGSREFIQKLLHAIVWREGIGGLLAEGSARVADQIKNGWEFCGKYFPAYGSAAHGPLRDNRGVALLWALDSRCPVIDQHT